MKRNRTFSLLCISLFLSACSSKTNHEVCFVTNPAIDSIQTEPFIREGSGLNMFYNICADDSFLYCLDFYNDTILKAYPQTSFPVMARYATKGQGPDDLILPFFTREIVQKGGNIKMTDVNAWSLREINPTRSTRIHLNTTRLPIVPMMQDYAETDLCIYGTNIDSPECLFFIYDKNKQKVKDIRYWDEKQLKSKYPDTHIPFLFTGNLLLHPERGICRTMNNLNSLFFFDLQGELLKEVVIGTERIWPEADPQFLDFPQANKYVLSLTGNQECLYILYNGYPANTQGACSKILRFDWEGNLLKSIQTDRDLSQIALTPDGNCLYAIANNEEGGTDVVRITF